MKSILIRFILPLLLMSAFALALAPTKARPEDALPILWIKIHRIQAVDPIEGFLEDGADWHYYITVSDGETTTSAEYKCPSGHDDLVLDRIDSFSSLKHKDISITINLKEDDLFGQEQADISGSSGNQFYCTYHLKTNNFDGDQTILEQGYYKTSGDYDGSISKDENDANLWFLIWDNYESPGANAGSDVQCYSGDKVNFDGSSSTASEGSSIVKYEWDFENDGIIDAEGARTSNIYQTKGSKTCRLRVTDSIGEIAEDTCVVDVVNKPPTAQFTRSPSNPTVRDNVTFTDQSNDPDGYLASWLWDFGDGANSTLQSPSHTFAQKGSHQVTLRVTDNNGATNVVSVEVVVYNLPPTACFNCSSSTPRTNTDIQFVDATVDPENLPLHSWLWDFGDGYTSDLQSPTHKFASKGDYNVTLTVCDDENAASTFSTLISVTDTPPPEVPVVIPVWIVALVIAIFATLGISLVYLRRRKTPRP